MAQIPGFKYDIFISYTHDDNHSPTGGSGWVERFHDDLESRLKHRRGFKAFSIWRDKELDGNTVFNAAIEEKIRHSALFFVLHSRNYLRSDYCRKELQWFHKYHGERPGGLIVGEHHRIFNILLNNFPYQNWPDELKAFGETSGFAMHDAQSPDKLGDFTSPNDERFEKQLRRIVDAVEATLEEFLKLKPVVDEREANGHKVRVFVADVADSLGDFRERIIDEVVGSKAQVLRSIPPPMESVQHAASVKNALARAHLSIHLFDQSPGRKILDQKTATYPRTQWEIALSSAVRKLVWVPPDLNLSDDQNDAQREFLNNLANGDRSSGQYEFVQRPQTAFLDVVRDIVAQLQMRLGNGAPRRTFFMDTHQKDQRYAFKLADLLAERGLDVEFNQESRDPTLSLARFEQSIRQVQNLIILAGKVDLAWLKGRIKKAFKIVSEQLFEASDSLALENIWVFLAPASGGRVELPQFPPLIKINILDNSHAEAIDLQVISPLLQQANAGGST
jgi:hypothetical protein